MALRAVADIWAVPFGSSKKVRAGEVRIASIKKQLGSPLTLPDGTIMVATYPPSFGMRPGSRQYAHVIREHIARAAKIAVRGYIDWHEPDYILDPSVDQIEATLERMTGKDKIIDIETDKGTRADGSFDPMTCRIRCIGFGSIVDGRELVIAVPLRKMNGEEWWEPEDKKRVVLACMKALNDYSVDATTGEQARLVGHNMAFDTSVLLRFRLMLDRDAPFEDTILMHHDTADNDLPHDLGFVTSRYFEVPSWKSGADDKYYDQVTDHDLHLYNCRDIVSTMRIFYHLETEILRYGTVDQYEMDKKLAPVARDMGELGLFIDEVKRGELSIKMNHEAHSRLLRLKEITGNAKFNPSSSHQIRHFLFVEKKHIPLLNSKGTDWEEGECPATNVQALMKMVAQQSCDPQTKDFINTLLEYRAYMKLKGTYIDKLKVHYPNWASYGVDVPLVPAVRGPVWRKYSARERTEIAQVQWAAEWDADSAKHARKKLLERVEDGVWEEAEIIPERPALSRLHTSYKLHIIPSGRMSTQPAVQNWPKFGKANMHEMVVAPPGHVMVGADLDQVELRIYAAIAGDKLLLEAFHRGLDPHSYNAASLFAKRFGKSIWDTYLYIVGLPDAGAMKAAQEWLKTTPSARTDIAVDADFVKRFNTATQTCVTTSGTLDVDAVAVSLGRPKALVEAMLAGHKKGDKEKKKLRGYAKTFAYLECYGGEADKLFAFMSVARDKGTGALMFPDLKEEDVHEWHNEWHRTHPETKAWQEACQRVARREGFTAVPLGSYRKRYFPGGPNKPGATFNHVIQGAAAEIANAALLKIAKAIPYQSWSPFTGPCLQVHDYIGCYVPEEHGERAKQIIEDALNGEISNGIKITASAVISMGLATQ
jgi:DNA polymerase I-like protein with 3'-5' exonuclease and polymerase domains